MEETILRLLGRKDYTPLNIPQMLSALGLKPNQQQELQRNLRELELSGQLTRTKGNRYIKSVEADLVAGTSRMNRQGNGFLPPDEPGLPEIVVPDGATST